MCDHGENSRRREGCPCVKLLSVRRRDHRIQGDGNDWREEAQGVCYIYVSVQQEAVYFFAIQRGLPLEL